MSPSLVKQQAENPENRQTRQLEREDQHGEKKTEIEPELKDIDKHSVVESERNKVLKPAQKQIPQNELWSHDDLQVPTHSDRTGGKKTGSRSKFHPDGIDWELEEEMEKRRAAFFAAVEAKQQIFNDSDYTDMHEKDDDFTFVTAGSHSTYPAAIEFVYSIQYFYPDSNIAVYDIGFTKEEKNYINNLCRTEVVTLWLEMWPESLYTIRHRVWRALVLQFAMAKFGHYVYVEPGRFVYKQGIRDYIDASRKHGVVFGGRQLKHSSFVVTNPHMYTFLRTNERKLQATPHFELSLAVIHNTRRVKHEFMRFLVSCALEEYCISPPGSKSSCDINLGNNKKYARCHRYDESAINLIVNRWHDYQPREYLLRDLITRPFDGRDMTSMVRRCNNSARKDEI
ncbi:hypothetical protein EGW08_003740 [Elysia chlorotica]|uniref:Uncharacterized protein n=1 Tax=Elysia chlorotica TaxID=188477 RepID=A0A3S1HY87_ELYCH|nr:hypothetical protein EGW08_003740 [Elysia chlorotica]